MVTKIHGNGSRWHKTNHYANNAHAPVRASQKKICNYLVDVMPGKLWGHQKTAQHPMINQFSLGIPYEWCRAATWAASSTWSGRTSTLRRMSKRWLFAMLQGAKSPKVPKKCSTTFSFHICFFREIEDANILELVWEVRLEKKLLNLSDCRWT